jgi:hypothetical protein
MLAYYHMKFVYHSVVCGQDVCLSQIQPLIIHKNVYIYRTWFHFLFADGVIYKNAKMALNLSDVIHDEIGLNLYRGSVLQ